jgi:putative glutamine amidotransferase
MKPLIAIPVPHSSNSEYSARALPHYVRAVESAGAAALPVTLENLPEALARCHAVLLPGSRADVDPAKYEAAPHPECAAADRGRETLDWRLLDHAYAERKPVLGICYGLQSLNVYRGGTLVQHIESQVKHENKAERHAHRVTVTPESLLASILRPDAWGGWAVDVNSSHHQAAAVPGRDLRTVAECPDDRVVEALEGTAPDHFVVAVQWHPERSLDEEPSQALFRALVEAARNGR